MKDSMLMFIYDRPLILLLLALIRWQQFMNINLAIQVISHILKVITEPIQVH